MFLGHGLLAFALLAALGRAAGWQRERTLELAALAAVFATLPDVDILYALVGLFEAHSGALAAADAFWQTASVVHRAVTHSIVVAPVVAFAVFLWATSRGTDDLRRSRLGPVAAIVVLGSLLLVTTAVSGTLAGVIMTVFAVGALVVTEAASRRGTGPAALCGVALVGLLSHPFGDLLTGEPPALLYPFDVTLLTERVLLHPDPTVHLLGAFFVELAVVWLAVAAYHDLRGRRLRESVAKRATLGLGYAGLAFTLPAPTLESSYQFVFTALAVGAIGPVRLRLRQDAQQRPTGPDGAGSVTTRFGLSDARTAFVTGLTAITLAALGYTLVYLFV